MIIHTRKLGNGFIEGFFNVRAIDTETGHVSSIIERVFGGGDMPEFELLRRLRIRFPNQKVLLKAV